MPFRVELKKSAEREFGRLPKDSIRRFAQAIDRLAVDPTHARPGVDIKKLHGSKNTRRLRVGDYRGIYELMGDRIIFTRFAHRSKVHDA